MGEVFLARDTKENRDVAIKVLPAGFAADPDRRARFEREAQLLAVLNHPNVAQIYGSLDAGESVEHPMALVMEFVEGDDLAQRLRRGALLVAEALAIARQLAEALEAAHGQGVIHRDLKPANVKVRSDGVVKVLDFGLAKALEPAGTSGQADVANSPTLTGRATQAGVILGTAAYVAPEQARGRPVDRRADVWAFGCVLFEMLTGTRAFGGDDVTDVLAAVVRAEPEWAALPGDTPTAVRRLLRRCLEKDPRRRLHDVADARIELDDALSGAPEPGTHVVSQERVAPDSRVRERVAWAIATASLIALVVTLALPRGSAPVEFASGASTYSAAVVLPAAMRWWPVEPSGRFALSPDGRKLALVVLDASGQTILSVRPIDADGS